LDDIRANATAMKDVKALAPLLYEEAALSAPATHQSEPRVSLIGLDPATQRPDDVALQDEVADKLGVKAGDSVSLHYAPAPVPRIPKLFLFNGSVTASAGACPVPGTPACAFVSPPTDATSFQV